MPTDVYVPLPYLTWFMRAETVLLIYVYPPVLLFPNWVDFTPVLKNAVRILCAAQHMTCRGSYREAKGTVHNLKYVLPVQLAKQDRKLSDNVNALKSIGRYGDEGKFSEETKT